MLRRYGDLQLMKIANVINPVNVASGHLGKVQPSHITGF